LKKLWLPLGFIGLIVLLGVGLTLNPRQVPSPLIGKAAPPFELPRLDQPAQTFTQKEMLGNVWVLNVWASWCGPCREEHPQVLALSRAKLAPLVGLNYKDTGDEARGWLKQFGDPYTVSLADSDGRTGIDFGVYGVPETFVIDKQGVIRFKHIGPLTQSVIDTQIVPLLKQLNG